MAYLSKAAEVPCVGSRGEATGSFLLLRFRWRSNENEVAYSETRLSFSSRSGLSGRSRYLAIPILVSKTERLTNKYHLVIIGMWHYRSRQAVSVLTSCAFILYREEVGPMEYIIITLVLILLLILAIKKD